MSNVTIPNQKKKLKLFLSNTANIIFTRYVQKFPCLGPDTNKKKCFTGFWNSYQYNITNYPILAGNYVNFILVVLFLHCTDLEMWF